MQANKQTNCLKFKIGTRQTLEELANIHLS